MPRPRPVMRDRNRRPAATVECDGCGHPIPLGTLRWLTRGGAQQPACARCAAQPPTTPPPPEVP